MVIKPQHIRITSPIHSARIADNNGGEDKKSKYKNLARRYKDTLAKREQELTEFIVESNELKTRLDKLTRFSRDEAESLRSEVGRLMDENHRYSRDVDRLT